MNSVKDLVDALESGDTSKINSTFNNIMTLKVTDALDSFKQDVANSLFNTNTSTELDVEE